MILESVENGPLIWPTIEENGVIRTNKYVELSVVEKIQVECDMKATNIILQEDDLIAYLNKAMAFLTVVASSSPEETMQVDRKGLLNVTTVKTKDLDTYDYDCDDVSNVKVVLMANISNYGFDVISEELLVYVRDTCPNAINLSEKKVAVIAKNNVKKVRFAEPLTSSSNIKQVESSKTSYSMTHVLSPTGLKCSTSNYRSKPSGNKKNDRISQTPSRNMKNKVEAQPKNVNKRNHVVEPIHNVDVKQS
nr:hypothetical protein [Tanacetum cinerariifolium]